MLSIEKLIEKQCKSEEKTIVIHIDQLGDDVKIRVPFMEEFKELLEKHKDNQANVKFDLVYQNMIEPKLNDDKLLTHFNCKDKPYLVVERIFGGAISDNISALILDEREKDNTVKIVNDKIDAVKN